ncbi:DUF4303 domain-containing protein [Paenibacillus sp. MER TA 81-3]|nr:DUF4303 domain-containing protein [Paenibacillus sp. MER TA 81-3]
MFTLEDEENENQDVRFLNFRDTLFKTGMDALEVLTHSNFFTEVLDRRIIVLFTVMDNEFENDHYLQIVKRLNNEDTVNEYAKWLEEWCD